MSNRITMWLVTFIFMVLAQIVWSDINSISVTISNGTITGYERTYNTVTVQEFLGIPFAQPPVGNLRFALPKPIANSWLSNFVADKAGNFCMQPIRRYEVLGFPPTTYPERFNSSMSEDCLYLNIWVPTNTSNRKSVLVWIHGGGYFTGSTLPLYNGAALAATGDVIVVSIHYRLGIFGFLRLDNDTATGNWGLWDQRLALQWVHENIAQFGGDPNSVTIFGESAGAGSVGLHLLSSGSLPYFKRAILQSGSPLNTIWSYSPYTERIMARYKFFTEVQVSCQQRTVAEQLTCLRRKSSAEILNSALALAKTLPLEADFRPIMDYAFFKEDALTLIKERRLPNKDIIIGATNDEGGNMAHATILAAAKRANQSIAQFFKGSAVNQRIQASFRYFPGFPNQTTPTALNVLKMKTISKRDPQNGDFNIRRLAYLYSDFYFYAGMNAFADIYASLNNTVYMYIFGKRPSMLTSLPSWMEAGHMMELFFMFGDPIQYPSVGYTVEEKALSEKMVRDWATFAKTGMTNSAEWVPYTMAKKEFLYYDTPTSTLGEYGYRRDESALFDTILPYVSGLMPIPLTPPATEAPKVPCSNLTTTGQVLTAVFCSLTAVEAAVIIFLVIRLKSDSRIGAI